MNDHSLSLLPFRSSSTTSATLNFTGPQALSSALIGKSITFFSSRVPDIECTFGETGQAKEWQDGKLYLLSAQYQKSELTERWLRAVFIQKKPKIYKQYSAAKNKSVVIS